MATSLQPLPPQDPHSFTLPDTPYIPPHTPHTHNPLSPPETTQLLPSTSLNTGDSLWVWVMLQPFPNPICPSTLRHCWGSRSTIEIFWLDARVSLWRAQSHVLLFFSVCLGFFSFIPGLSRIRNLNSRQ